MTETLITITPKLCFVCRSPLPVTGPGNIAFRKYCNKKCRKLRTLYKEQVAAYEKQMMDKLKEVNYDAKI